MRGVELERPHVLLGYDRIDKTDGVDMNSMLINVGETMEPEEVKVPKAPYDWVDPAPKTAKGEPTFNEVDNPYG